MSETTLGSEWARALSEKDFDGLAELLHPQIDFRALTPRRSWEADDPEALITGVLRVWFDDSDEIETLERVETDAFSDRERVGYRFRRSQRRRAVRGRAAGLSGAARRQDRLDARHLLRVFVPPDPATLGSR